MVLIYAKIIENCVSFCFEMPKLRKDAPKFVKIIQALSKYQQNMQILHRNPRKLLDQKKLDIFQIMGNYAACMKPRLHVSHSKRRKLLILLRLGMVARVSLK